MKSEDEIIDEFLRAEDIHHRGSVDYQELVNREMQHLRGSHLRN